MSQVKQKAGRLLAVLIALTMVISSFPSAVFAEESTQLEEGEYTVDVSLSAYIDSMGGIEFGGVMTEETASLVVDSEGNARITLTMGVYEMTIMTVTCSAFVDATDSTPGIYVDGEIQDIDYTLSEETAATSSDEVQYVDSLTFDLPDLSGSCTMFLYINSNVMGVQFCDGSGTGTSNQPGVETPYIAVLTVDLSEIPTTIVETEEEEETEDTEDESDTVDENAEDSEDSEDDQEEEDITETEDESSAESSAESSEEEDSSEEEEASEEEADEELDIDNLEAGTYSINAVFSAYIDAMGGIEFGDGLIENEATLTVDEEGVYNLTITTKTNTITIYTITVEAFIDAEDSAPGCYTEEGMLVSVGYTVSDDTALDSDGNAVHYVDSLSMVLDTVRDTYVMYLYVNSNVMGVQFCDGSGTGSSNEPGVDTPYAAYLNLDWDSLTLVSSAYEEVETTTDETAAEEASETIEDSGEEEEEGSSTEEEEEEDTEVLYGLDPGTYYPGGSLSAYISAMGGVEFGSGLLDGLKVVVNEDGTYTITIYFTTSNVTIYSLTVDTFVDATDSPPGYYDADGNLHDASYTLSSNTAEDADGNQIHYVDSMTFTVDELSSSYYLYIYINSSVMGVQFCDGSGSGSSNEPGVATPYKALLTIDWSSVGAAVSTDNAETGDSSHTALWVVLMALSAAALVVVDGKRRSMNEIHDR